MTETHAGALHEVQQAGHRPARYVGPSSLEHVLEILAAEGAAARVVAGGTDLLVELDRGGRSEVETLVDLSRLDGLDAVHRSPKGLHLGPLVTHNQCATDPLIRSLALPLSQASAEVGSPALRNRATVVGNVVTASPANDTISALIALDAELSIASTRGLRSVPVDAFFTGFRSTVLAPDEIVTGITLAPVEAPRRGVYAKLGLRRAQAISVVHVAVVVTIGDDGTVVDPRVVLGSVSAVVSRSDGAEAALVGRRLDADTIRAAADAATLDAAPIDDLRSPADYRAEQVAVMIRRCLEHLADGPVAVGPPPPVLGGPTVPAPAEGAARSWSDGDQLSMTVDGSPVEAGWTSSTLLAWLRDEADVTTTKEGCAEGECGACTVLIDGVATLSCLVPSARAAGATVTTAAGVADGDPGTAGRGLSELQQRFVDEAAVQCGFCIPGFIVAGTALRNDHPTPTDEQVATGLSGNLCRCTGYYKIQEAFR